MELLRKNIRPGEVYRRSDLEYYSTAIDRHLRQLTTEGELIKLNQGLYYAPEHSKFGPVPPDDSTLVARFLKSDEFLIVTPNAYNTLGLGLTQLYNARWVYNHKRRGEITLDRKTFLFKMKSAFPAAITKEYLLVDLLNNLDNLAEDASAVVYRFRENIRNFSTDELMNASQLYGSGETKKILKSVIRKVNLKLT
ncbi:MAG: hypothetical protein RLZ62_843 [Bacteroidota bacterium]|jgi:hypothetical protein